MAGRRRIKNKDNLKGNDIVLKKTKRIGRNVDKQGEMRIGRRIDASRPKKVPKRTIRYTYKPSNNKNFKNRKNRI